MFNFELKNLTDSQRAILVEIFKIDIGASLNILRDETDSERIRELAERLAFTIACYEKLLSATSNE